LRRIGPVRQLHYYLASPQTRRLLTRFRPDIINPHFATGYGWLAARAGGRAPIVLNLWGSDILIVPHKSPLHREKALLALQSAAAVVGDSDYLLARARRLAPGIADRTSAVIPWGLERAHLALHKSDYAFQRPLRIIVPRTQAAIYNNEFIVRALAPMLHRGVVTLTFPAWGPLAARFRETVSTYPVGAVRLYERLPRRDYLSLAAGHDIYLSAAASDSSPASLIEAMGLGLLPIAAAIEGVREWLTPRSGYLFRPDRGEELRGIIENLLASDDPQADLRRANLERVKRDAIFENNVAAQLDLMRRVAMERP
jgi:glycosyltransferase involved in cell wall biosynthesis